MQAKRAPKATEGMPKMNAIQSQKDINNFFKPRTKSKASEAPTAAATEL